MHKALAQGLRQLALQGYARVGVSAALNTAQSLAEICASVLVLAVLPPPAAGRLAALGGASIATAALAAAAGAPVCFSACSPVTGPLGLARLLARPGGSPSVLCRASCRKKLTRCFD